ncbi:MAG TPA: methyltransferase domain-containing protein [Chthoniobacterales bacterium]|jgi:SAM-dependent methyltransferase
MNFHSGITGIGLSDSELYADRLAEKFSYLNTFYHQEPRLDISDPKIAPELLDSQDFIISSDVFEHVAPPIDNSFRNAWRILRPGGSLILSVPYGLQEETVEHFPELHDYEFVAENETHILRNTTKTGEIQRFEGLAFHGGPGATVEMRIFARADLVRRLTAAGFEEITIHQAPDFAHGIWWPEPMSFPISANKPRTNARRY